MKLPDTEMLAAEIVEGVKAGKPMAKVLTEVSVRHREAADDSIADAFDRAAAMLVEEAAALRDYIAGRSA